MEQKRHCKIPTHLWVLVRQLLQRLQALFRQVDVLDGQQPAAQHLHQQNTSIYDAGGWRSKQT